MTTTALLAIAYLLILATSVGWVTFRLMYRPLSMRGHSRTGRHLIRTADSLILLLGMSLLGAVLPIPYQAMAVVTVVVLALMCWVAWERVALLRWERRERAARAAAQEHADDIEDTA